MKEHHKLLRKPWVSLIIYPIFATIVYVGIIGGILNLFMPKISTPEYASGNNAGRLGLMAGGIVALLIHWLTFRKDMVFRSRLDNIPKGFFLGMPLLIPVALNLINIDYSSIKQGVIIAAFLEALATAVYEEACFRVLPISAAMWSLRDEKKIPMILALPAVVFALFHVGAGSNPLNAFLSVLFGLGLGLMNGVIYLRSGSIIPAMIYHFLINFTGGLITVGNVNGTGAADTSSMVITLLVCTLLIAFSLFCVRPSTRHDIMNTWNDKFTE